MKNKILIIARAFPPKGGGGVQRIVKFSVYLKELGWDVTVCAPLLKKISWTDESRQKEIKEIKVIRIEEDIISNTTFSKVIRKLKFYDSFNAWAKKVQNYFLESNNFNFDYVLTSGPPHSIHRIGLELKNKYKFKWVSDFRDHYTLGPTYGGITAIHENIEKKFEQNIYEFSDLIIMNTEVNKKDILRNFDINPVSKIKSIYNGYDFDDLKLTGYKPNFIKSNINFLYLGGLRGDHIDGYFYKVVKLAKNQEPELLKNVVINLLGDSTRRGDMLKKLDIESQFNFFDSVPFDKVGDYIKASDGCLTWQNPNRGYRGTIPGKFFDYIGLKKPIYSLGQLESELSNIINNNSIGVHTDVNNLEQATNDFISFIKKIDEFNISYKSIDNEFYNSFYRKNQVKELNDYLLNLK